MITLEDIWNAVDAGRRTSWRRIGASGLITTDRDDRASVESWLAWACSEPTAFFVCLLDPDTERIELTVQPEAVGVSVSEV